MSQYIPTPAPSGDSVAALREWMMQELNRIARARSEPESVIKHSVLYAPPLKFAAGDEVYADGTTWNPGSGEGLYRRNKANALWVFVG